MNTKIGSQICIIIIIILSIIGFLLPGFSNQNNQASGSNIAYAYPYNQPIEIFSSKSITSSVYLPIIFGPPEIISETIAFTKFGLSGYGTNWEEAWTTPDFWGVNLYDIIAGIYPTHDTIIPPADYRISRAYIDIPLPTHPGNIQRATLRFEAGCTVRNSGMAQPEAYLVKLASWKDNASPQELWFPPPYSSTAPVMGSISPNICKEHAYPLQLIDIELNVTEINKLSNSRLQLVIIHPDEEINLRTQEDTDVRASIRAVQAEGHNITLIVYYPE